jgi:hemerythrin superfamily protein
MTTSMDKIVSTGKGKLKGVKARLDGLTGIFKTLTAEHGEVSALLERAKDSVERRAELWPTIRAQLLSHERGEIRELYPVLRSMDATAELADHHDAEAKDMEDMILDLDHLPITTDAWGLLFDQLADAVLHHAEEEETEMFPQAQAALGEALTQELDAKFRLTKQQLLMAV